MTRKAPQANKKKESLVSNGTRRRRQELSSILSAGKKEEEGFFLVCKEKQILIRHWFKERKVFCLIVAFLYKREVPEEEKEKRDLKSLSKHL